MGSGESTISSLSLSSLNDFCKGASREPFLGLAAIPVEPSGASGPERGTCSSGRKESRRQVRLRAQHELHLPSAGGVDALFWWAHRQKPWILAHNLGAREFSDVSERIFDRSRGVLM